MSQAMLRGRCGKCDNAFVIPVTEVPLHVYGEELLCWQCCKEVHWYEANRCKHCSEKTMCKGLFLSNMKKALDKTKGV